MCVMYDFLGYFVLFLFDFTLRFAYLFCLLVQALLLGCFWSFYF